MMYFPNFLSLKIVSKIASCDHPKSKLRTVAKDFWVADLRGWQVKISRKSCFDKLYTFQFKEFYFHIFIISGSEETKRGCEKINEIRIEKGFQPLDIHLIKLVDDSCHDLGPIFL